MRSNAVDDTQQGSSEFTGDLVTLIEAAGDQFTSHALISCDSEARITSWLLGAAELFGYSADVVLGQPVWMLAAAGERATERSWPEIRIAESRGAASCDRWLRSASGEPFWGTGTVVRLMEDSRTAGFAFLLQDGTPIRHKLETLEKQVADGITSQQAKDRFIARLSHELRNPLTAIVFGVEALRQAKHLDADDLEALDVVARQSDALHRLVDDLLDASRLACGKLQMIRRRVPITHLVRAAAETCAAQAQQRRHHLTVAAADSGAFVDCDPQRMQQVFVNLLQNAIKFTPDGGRLQVETGIEQSEIFVRITDSGVGIDSEFLPQLFEMFAQCDNDPDRSKMGLGIGLSVAKEIVALHGGRIEARSAGRGLGAEFVVRLPSARQPG